MCVFFLNFFNVTIIIGKRFALPIQVLYIRIYPRKPAIFARFHFQNVLSIRLIVVENTWRVLHKSVYFCFLYAIPHPYLYSPQPYLSRHAPAAFCITLFAFVQSPRALPFAQLHPTHACTTSPCGCRPNSASYFTFGTILFLCHLW